MIRLPTLLALLAAFSWPGPASGQPVPAAVEYTHRGSLQAGFLKVGDDVWAPLPALGALGWNHREIAGGDEVDIFAEGRRLRLPVETRSEGRGVLLLAAVEQLGAQPYWSDDGATFHVLGSVRDVRLEGDRLIVTSTLAVRPHVFRLNEPDRIVVDLYGAVLRLGPGVALPDFVRVAQFKENVVRLVVEHPVATKAAIPRLEPSRSVQFELPGLLAAGERSAAPEVGPLPILPLEWPPAGAAEPIDPASEAPPVFVPPEPPESPTPPGQTPRTEIEPPRVRAVDETEIVLALGVSGTVEVFPSARYDDVRTVRVSIPNARLREGPPAELPEAWVRAYRADASGPGGVELVFETPFPVAFQLRRQGDAILLHLMRPRQTDGRLAGKLVVVDPGHGGNDSGAVWAAEGLREKDLNLRTSRLLAEALIEAGASVILTRDDDRRIPLQERAGIANRSRADIFVSVHYNSNRVADSRSGNMTFFHRQDPIGKLLAKCIQDEIAKVSGLPSLGEWSDTRIHENGFAVLRAARMPAVLLELGFINHRVDRRRIQTADFQNKVVAAIVRGLQVFVGEKKASP